MCLSENHLAWKVSYVPIDRWGYCLCHSPEWMWKNRAARQLCGLDHTPQPETAPAIGVVSEWQGKPLTEFDTRSRAIDFGFIPSNPQLLFSMIGRTLRQELELAFGVLGREVDRGDKQVADWFELRPLLDRDYRDFSGATNACGFGVCLVKKPKVVITDQLADRIDPNFGGNFTILARWSRQDGGIQLHFATALRDNFGGQAQQCGFFTEQEFITGTPQDCWKQLGRDRLTLLGGPMRLGAILHQENLAVFDSMPCNAEAVASALTDQRAYATSIIASPSTLDSGGFAANISEFAYPKGGFHLRDVTLRVPVQTLCAVLGPNGAGKTTLLKCIANLVGPWNGTVSINGHQYDTKLSLPKTAHMALYCFQNPDDQLYRSTVAKELLECVRNITGSERAFSKEDLELAESFGLRACLEVSPFDLPLSLRRLLVIASCLIARPPLLLLDEPTAWLDAQQKKVLEAALCIYLGQGGCAFAVSHDLDWISIIASQLVFLTDGKIIQQVESSALPAGLSLPYPPTCLQVAERLPDFPKLWQEKFS